MSTAKAIVDLGLARVGLTAPIRQEAQGLMEYGLILAFVSILAIGALFFFGSGIASLLGIGAAAAP